MLIVHVLILLLVLLRGYIPPFLPPFLKRNLPSAETIDMLLIFSTGIVMGAHLKDNPFSEVAPIFLIAIGVYIALFAVNAMGQRSWRNRGSAPSKR